MALPNLPRLTRSGQTWTGTLPCTWMEASRPVGGGEVSAAGIPSHYTIRHDPLLRVILRVRESEWASLATFLRAVDDGALSFTFHPDTNVSGTSFTVYLESPSVANGEEISPTRDDRDPGVLLVSITLRRTTSTVFALPLYPDA